MKKKETIGYAILAVLLFAAFTSRMLLLTSLTHGIFVFKFFCSFICRFIRTDEEGYTSASPNSIR